MLYLSVSELGYYKYYYMDISKPESILLLDTPLRYYKSRDVWGTVI